MPFYDIAGLVVEIKHPHPWAEQKSKPVPLPVQGPRGADGGHYH